MRTSIPDVYAIGDAVAIYHAALRRHQQVALATNAVKSGIAAASHINGIAGVAVGSVAGTKEFSMRAGISRSAMGSGADIINPLISTIGWYLP